MFILFKQRREDLFNGVEKKFWRRRNENVRFHCRCLKKSLCFIYFIFLFSTVFSLPQICWDITRFLDFRLHLSWTSFYPARDFWGKLNQREVNFHFKGLSIFLYLDLAAESSRETFIFSELKTHEIPRKIDVSVCSRKTKMWEKTVFPFSLEKKTTCWKSEQHKLFITGNSDIWDMLTWNKFVACNWLFYCNLIPRS